MVEGEKKDGQEEEKEQVLRAKGLLGGVRH